MGNNKKSLIFINTIWMLDISHKCDIAISFGPFFNIATDVAGRFMAQPLPFYSRPVCPNIVKKLRQQNENRFYILFFLFRVIYIIR